MPLPFVAWHERNATSHKQELDKYAAQGFRTLSLCVHGDRNDPRYTAVMVKRPVVQAQKQFFAMSAAEWQQTFNDMAQQGYGPMIVSATGPRTNPLFAAVFAPMSPIPLTRHDLTVSALQQLNAEAQENNQILHWADAYGTAADPRYVAVWYPNTDNIAWNCDSVFDDGNTAQQRFNAIAAGWAHPAHIALAPGQKVLELYTDAAIGPWVSRAALTSDGYQQEFNTHTANGLMPIRVAAEGTGASTRYAAIFASRDTHEPREFRSSQAPVSIAAIDNAMKGIMQVNQIRGASIAITKGARLVYTKGYTWAEKSYPDVQPTTRFRQASVSKLFAAVATYQLIEEGKLTLNTTLQSVLNLKTPTGGNPTDANFSKITIRHLLEGTSGIPADLIWRDVEATTAFGTSLPATPAQLTSWCASRTLTCVPGTVSKAVYNNGAYFVLSQVVAKLRNAASFEAAITGSLLNPLKITRVRGSRTKIASQLSDEARYHPRPLITSTSLAEASQPMVTLGYGDTNMENCDGCGGLSAAATDVARLVAALSVRQSNPMLKEETITSLFANSAASTAANTSGAWGFHGLDSTYATDAEKGLYYGWKGGSLNTSQNGIYVERDGWGCVICWNGKTPEGDTWFPKLNAAMTAAANHDWGTTDLFPDYGMPAFPKPLRIIQSAVIGKITARVPSFKALSLSRSEVAEPTVNRVQVKTPQLKTEDLQAKRVKLS